MTQADDVRRVRATGVMLSALGAGTASLGNVFGNVDEGAAVSLLGACLEHGVRYVDTAPLYGNGLSESRLGRALAELGGPDVTISTKVGRTLDPATPDGWRHDFSRDAILRGLDASLQRLGRDRVDILYLHDPDEFEADVYATAWPTLEGLRAEGTVGAIGVGMNQWQMPLRFIDRLDLDIVMIAGRYTLLDTGARELLLPACAEAGVAVVAAGVFNSGILVDPVDGAWYDYHPASTQLLEQARAIRDHAARYSVSLGELALWFAASHPAVTSVVVGVGSAVNLTKNAAALGRAVPRQLLDELMAAGLIGQ